MLKNVLMLDDGSEIVAGYVGQNAIMSLSHTAMVSSTTDLVPGAACSAKIEVTIWVAPGGSLVITSGTRMRYYREDASGDRTLVGTFWAVKPTRQTRNTYKVLAYDRMTLLDKDLSPWLREQQGAFPMTVKALVQTVCAQCGVEIVPGNLEAQVNTGYNVPAFYTDNLTGRQVIQWAAQAMCRFARMTPAGQLEFAWYTDHARSGIGPGAGSAWTALDLSGQLLATADGEVWTFAQPQAGYFSGTLSYEDYQVAPIDKVQIRQSQDDVGVIYPPGETATNALVLQGNLLLATQTADALRPVARAIFEQMQDVTYTPLQVSIPLDAGAPAPGEIITVTDAYGRTMQAYIMQRTISGQKVTLESTGNARRDGTSAVNNQKWQNLQGKMLEIKADVDGLNIKASELEGDYTELSQTVDGLSVSVVKDGEVRTAFAADTSSVTISSGRVTFSANTLVVNSDNFRLTETGSVSITGMFFSLGDQDQVAIHDGALFFSRKVRDGSWKESAQLYSSGENAACGNFVLFGPGADGKQKSGVAAYTNFSGGAFAVYNAAGMPQFMVRINGNGDAEIWFNGKKIM